MFDWTPVGPKCWWASEDDRAGGSVQQHGATTTENHRVCGDREDQGATVSAVSSRWCGASYLKSLYIRVILVSCITDKCWYTFLKHLCHQVFVSKDVARHFGYSTAESALKGLYSRVKQGWVGVRGQRFTVYFSVYMLFSLFALFLYGRIRLSQQFITEGRAELSLL